MLSKVDKIKLFQQALGSYPDGIPGESTWDSAYRFLMHEGYLSKVFPYASSQWGCYTMFGNPDNLTAFNAEGKTGVGSWGYSISGSFSYPSGVAPCSILVNKGVDIYKYSCHYWQGKPETVLYWLNNGSYGMTLCKDTSELPQGVKWAIGGGQLMRDGACLFEFEAEGFTGIYSDVKRTTAHCGLGFDKFRNVMAVYHPNCSLSDFQQKCSNIGMIDGIFLDGGHISAINADELKANIDQHQGFIIQL